MQDGGRPTEVDLVFCINVSPITADMPIQECGRRDAM
jgi:hypothetical protein